MELAEYNVEILKEKPFLSIFLQFQYILVIIYFFHVEIREMGLRREEFTDKITGFLFFKNMCHFTSAYFPYL